MFPLTSAQRGVWFDQLLHPEEPLYNMGGYLRIDGAIDEVVFEASLRTLVDRHDALRIVLRNTGDDVPQQEFLHDVDFDLPWLDLSAEEDPDAAAMAWMRARLDTPFALFDAPLFDFAMLRLAPDRIVWFHKYHHIVFDAWSHSLVVQDLARIYASLLEGAAPPDTPHSYRDAIEDDQKYLQSPAFAADAEYWRERFAAHPEPVIERKSFGDSIAHERAVLVLPRGFYDRIEMLAKENGASTFHVIVAALYIYFTRIARREDLAIGLPTLNRGSAALKRTAGLFAALIPFWLQQPHDVTTVALLQEIGRKLRRDYRHLRLPIAEINRIAGLHKHGRVQLFDIVVTYQKQSYDVEFGGAPVEQFSLRHGAEQTPLAVEISEYNEQLDVRVNIDYSLTAFTAEEIAAFQRRLVHLLEEMVDAPSKAIGDLELLPPDERDAMLARGRRVCTFAPEETLVERFESQVRRTPHAKAVAYDAQSLTQSLTYDELNRRANQLARHLQSQGAGPGTRVAICLERSLDLVIAILGVLKCGAAYVPLEPSDPPERRAFIVTDSGADVILTHSRTPGGPSPDAALILRVDTDSDVIAACEDGDLALHREPSAPAYLIYTSGSTGRPKGTLVTHHNVVRLFLASQRLYRFDASDVWTLFHSTAFDFSVWEIFGALLHGGTLVVVPYWVTRAPDEFYRLMSEQRVTVLNQTPSAFDQLMRAEGMLREPLPLALRWIIFGGEALDAAKLRPWFEQHGDASPQLVNMYGITETTVHVTHRELTAADADARGSRIGKPLPDLDLYVLDERMQPAPIGVAGELFVGGDGVAAGYLNRADLNEQRFIRDPFSSDPNARLYRTGDAARWLPDGDLEYLGRFDDQVKIRGFRIELGEIRDALNSHPQVNDSVVLVREQQLVAYFCVATAASAVDGERPRAAVPTPTDLRAFLRRTLPDYMVPSFFVPVPMFPLTSNGKIDKRALPEPDRTRPTAAAVYIEPQRGPEKAIADVWKGLLRVDRPGLHDNFFELGGHSVLLVRARTQLEEIFGRKLSIPQMFAHPTIASLATLLASEGPSNA